MDKLKTTCAICLTENCKVGKRCQYEKDGTRHAFVICVRCSKPQTRAEELALFYLPQWNIPKLLSAGAD